MRVYIVLEQAEVGLNYGLFSNKTKQKFYSQ